MTLNYKNNESTRLESVKFYLLRYLDFLTQAGSHRLLDLPEFSDSQEKANINHTLYKDPKFSALLEGFRVVDFRFEEINSALHSEWLKCVRMLQMPADKS